MGIKFLVCGHGVYVMCSALYLLHHS